MANATHFTGHGRSERHRPRDGQAAGGGRGRRDRRGPERSRRSGGRRRNPQGRRQGRVSRPRCRARGVRRPVCAKRRERAGARRRARELGRRTAERCGHRHVQPGRARQGLGDQLSRDVPVLPRFCAANGRAAVREHRQHIVDIRSVCDAAPCVWPGQGGDPEPDGHPRGGTGAGQRAGQRRDARLRAAPSRCNHASTRASAIPAR